MKTWLRDIERASDPHEIVASARDYISLWSPRELPEGAREIRIEDEADIPRLRERLVTGVGPAAQGSPERFRDLVTYLSRASERLGELRNGQS
jgi:hypothetical protein